jgi:uncharacterized protein YceK
MRVLLRGLGAAALLALPGCGTIGNLMDRPQIYGGVRYDCSEVARGTGPCNPGVLMVFDVPFSLALDTVVLPFTAVYELVDGE